MNIPFKKTGVLLSACAVCFTLLRILQLAFCTEAKTGFFKSGYSAAGTEITIIIFIFVFLCFIFTFFEKKVPIAPPKMSPSLAIGNIALSLFLIADIIFFPRIFTAFIWQTVIYAVSGIIWIACLALSGASHFISLPFLSALKFKDNEFPPITAVAPIVFFTIRLFIYFSHYTSLAVTNDLLFSVMAQISIMFFLLIYGFLQNGLNTLSAQRRLLSVFSVSFLLCVAAGLPQLCITIAGKHSILHEFGINQITILGFAGYLGVLYFNLFASKNLKEKPRRHKKSRGRAID